MSMVEGLKAEGLSPYVVTEAKVLKGRLGAADFYFPDHKLAVQVDGEHHFRKRGREDTTEEAEPRDQAIRDENWNRECVKAGFNVWRVHFEDTTAPSYVLKAILQRAASNQGQPFVQLSNGFGKLNLI